LKRALKKRVKAVLKNTTQWDNTPAEQLNEVCPKVNRRIPTRAAMIGLAISMGATSLLVTRQSDQAQAVAPVDSQKAASTIPVVSETETKLTAINLESQVVSSTSMAGNPVAVASPTAVSQVPGLEAKWQIAANDKTIQVPASAAVPIAKLADKPGLHDQSVSSSTETASNLDASANGQQLSSPEVAVSQPTTTVANVNVVEDSSSSSLNAQLKVQQELALKRLQEKSHSLRKSLAQLRSEETKDLSVPTSAPTQVAAASPFTLADVSQSKLKSDQENSAAMQQLVVPATSPVKIAAKLPQKTYEVKPGDTLMAIASNYGISVSELAKANNLKNPNQLKISQKLIIPNRSANSMAAQQDVVIQSSDNQTNVVAIYPGNNSSIGVYPSADTQPLVTTKKVATRNSVVVPIPVRVNHQNQSNALAFPQETAPHPINSSGIGGDSPIPLAFNEVDLAQSPEQNIARDKGSVRLRSLQAEIDRLRQKYRAQESGVVIPTVPEPENTSMVAPDHGDSGFASSNTNLQLNAVQISVPPGLRTANTLREPINPEFLTNVPTGANGNHSRNKVSYAPIGVNATDSLGKLRGTAVSPQLPPLAAVDQYLPRAVDQNTFIPSATSATAYIWPAKGVLTSGYGWRWGRMHRGIDIANSTGTPIYASAPGVIERAGWNNGGYGNVVDIRHPDGSLTRYGHNSRILVQVGQQVQQGQQIAAMGSTGFSTGPHSHFEVHPAGKGAVNPIAFLPNRL
jgi:murein DD-endopeptidase MepM/ murein hydrolase activator NlpD